MGFLANKRILITGMISTRSLPMALLKPCIAKVLNSRSRIKASGFVNALKTWQENLPASGFPVRCGSDEEINQLFADLGKNWDKFDGFVHSIAYAPRDALEGEFLDGFNRETFRIAHDISAYSFPAMAKAALPLIEGRNAALLTMSYLVQSVQCRTTTSWAWPKPV